LARQTALAKEATFRQGDNHGFFAMLGFNGELHLAALDVEHRICRAPCEKTNSPAWYSLLVFPAASFARKRRESNEAVRLGDAPISTGLTIAL
jgi:hypothetical protein